MPLNKKMISISVPASLIPGLEDLSGPITLYMNKMHVDDGFAHANDEFVTSLGALNSAIDMAGIQPEVFAIMLRRA